MLFDIQPGECRLALPPVDRIEKCQPIVQKLLTYDPTDLYLRIHEMIDPYKRVQEFSLGQMFPNPDDGTCSCGCGVELTGRRTRWASDDCAEIPRRAFFIIKGYPRDIRFLIRQYYGELACVRCGETEMTAQIDIDHIIPVKLGGGGGWLSNYQPLCKPCHRQKTNEDFGYNAEI